jgi:biotin carboxyl carrier protein
MKKKYSLRFEDEQHNAVVAKQGDETAVQSCDDCELERVGCRPVLGGKALSLRIAGRWHLVHVTGLDRNGNLALSLAGRSVQVNVMDELKAQALESLGGGAASGTICADIPGLVVEVRVAEGDTVEPGQAVIVVEAMKMQNELTASVAGTVREIPVAVGQAVNPGDVLVVIEPAG